MLARVIESVTAGPLEAAVRRRVFGPLKMKGARIGPGREVYLSLADVAAWHRAATANWALTHHGWQQGNDYVMSWSRWAGPSWHILYQRDGVSVTLLGGAGLDLGVIGNAVATAVDPKYWQPRSRGKPPALTPRKIRRQAAACPRRFCSRTILERSEQNFSQAPPTTSRHSISASKCRIVSSTISSAPRPRPVSFGRLAYSALCHFCSAARRRHLPLHSPGRA